jgi:hypothetical protein
VLAAWNFIEAIAGSSNVAKIAVSSVEIQTDGPGGFGFLLVSGIIS